MNAELLKVMYINAGNKPYIKSEGIWPQMTNGDNKP